MKNITVLLIIVLFSCTGKQKKPGVNNSDFQTIKVNTKDIKKDVKLSDIIKLDSLVVFEKTEQSLIGKIDRVVITDDRIYVLDRHIAKTLFCFNRQGQFINSYHHFVN